MTPDTAPLGTLLEKALQSARTDVVLVAPFIKAPVLERLLHHIRPAIELVVITRWRADEVAVGVSDLETYDLLTGRQHSSLLLCNNLHAKFYRADSTVFIGSANLTATALGWISRPNLELLVNATALGLDYSAFEFAWRQASIMATADIQAIVRAAAASLPTLPYSDTRSEVADSLDAPSGCADRVSIGLAPMLWLPSARQPSQLFHVYTGDVENITTEGVRQATADLSELSIPISLSREQFFAYVRAELIQLPLVAQIDALAVEPQRFGAVTALVRAHLATFNATREPDEAWQTLMRWMLYFFGDRYEVFRPRHTEMFRKRAFSR